MSVEKKRKEIYERMIEIDEMIKERKEKKRRNKVRRSMKSERE